MRKQVLITAGTKNTGFVIAQTMAEKGYDLHLTSRRLEDAQQAAAKLSEMYPDIRAYGYKMELSNVASIRECFAQIRENTSSLDAFVANAANLGIGLDIFNSTEEDFDSVMDANLKGTFFCCQEAGKLMTEKGGSMVLVGSVQGKGAVEGRMLYGVSKAAISALSKYLAFDLAPYGIRANCLVAGAIHTDRWDGVEDDTLAQRRQNYPIGRESTMQEIANGVYYLASEQSASVTGTELVIDSGVLLSILPYKDRKQFKRENY